MSRDSTLIRLLRWDDKENFYRDYYTSSPEDQHRLLSREDIPTDWRHSLIDPDSFPYNSTEERFFEENRNVAFVKHTRFQPIFNHNHTFFEMIYVLTGQCTQWFGQDSMRLKEGDLCLLSPGVFHGVEVVDDSVILNVLVRTSTFMDIFFNAVRDKSQLSAFFLSSMYDKDKLPYLIYHTAGDESVRNQVLDMYEEYQNKDIYSDRIICSMLTIFFASLTRGHNADIDKPENPVGHVEFGDEILGYIMANYSTVTLADLAEAFHFSVPYCSKLVKQVCGMSFSDLVTRIRLQQGMNLLRTTQMSVQDISQLVGYKNPETFIRCFNRSFRMTPSQFRRGDL